MQNSDGTYFLMLEGIERYRIKEVLSVDPVLRVLCQKMEVSPPDAAGQSEDLRRHKRKRLETLLTQMGDRFPQFISQVNDIKKSDLSHSDFCDTVGGVFVGDVRLRQKLLQTVSVEKRLTLLCEFLDTGLLN
jgi:Lon protease-like protein